MSREVAFDELWKMGTTTDASYNCLMYHPCCDSWTTRQAKKARESHSERKYWKEVVREAKKAGKDRKEGLLAMMTEKKWKISAVLNQTCKGSVIYQPVEQPDNQVDQEDNQIASYMRIPHQEVIIEEASKTRQTEENIIDIYNKEVRSTIEEDHSNCIQICE